MIGALFQLVDYGLGDTYSNNIIIHRNTNRNRCKEQTLFILCN